MQVGAKNSTFGIKGVAENCHFFKTVEDAHRLRRHVAECFERASLPQTMQEVRRQDLFETGELFEGAWLFAETNRFAVSNDLALAFGGVRADIKGIVYCNKWIWRLQGCEYRTAP